MHLPEIREEMGGLTQKELFHRVKEGFPVAYFDRPLFCKIEKGQVLPNKETMEAICRVTGRKPGEIYDHDEVAHLAAAAPKKKRDRGNVKCLSVRVPPEIAISIRRVLNERRMTLTEWIIRHAEVDIARYERRRIKNA